MRTGMLNSARLRIDTRARKAAARMRTHACASTLTRSPSNTHARKRARKRARKCSRKARIRAPANSHARTRRSRGVASTQASAHAHALARKHAHKRTHAQIACADRCAGADPCERPARAAERRRLGDELGADDPLGGIREGVRVRAQSEPGLVLRRVLPGARGRTCYLSSRVSRGALEVLECSLGH